MALARVWSREHAIETRLEQYFARLRDVRLEITGDDLRGAGVAPGPRMGEVLRLTLDAKLDGEISGRDAELAYALEPLKPISRAPQRSGP